LIGFSDPFGETFQKSCEDGVAQVDLAEVQILGDFWQVCGNEAQRVRDVGGFDGAALGGIGDSGRFGGVEVALVLVGEAFGVELSFDFEDFGIGPGDPALAFGRALAQGDCGGELGEFGFCFALRAQPLDFGVLADLGLLELAASDGLGGLEFGLAFGVTLPHGSVLLGDDLVGFETAALALESDGVAVGGLHVEEEFVGHDGHGLDFHRGDFESQALGHIGEFRLHALDDRTAFAQGIVEAEVREFAADGRLDDLPEVGGDGFKGLKGVSEVDCGDRLLRFFDRVDREAHDFDALVLGGDLVRLEGHRLHGRRDKVGAVDARQDERGASPSGVEGFSEALVDEELGGAGRDESDSFSGGVGFCRFHAAKLWAGWKIDYPWRFQMV